MREQNAEATCNLHESDMFHLGHKKHDETPGRASKNLFVSFCASCSKRFVRLLGASGVLRLALAVVLVVLLAAGDAYACPTCKEGLAESDPSTQAMAAGYFYSILFMMSMPFLIIGAFGSFAYLSVRRARLADAQEAPSATLSAEPTA